MAQPAFSDNFGTDARSFSDGADNVVSFPQPERGSGATALELVYQAAEVFTGMEERAREIEASARSMCQSAVDKLMQAERRIEEAERARRDVIQEAGAKLVEASRALKLAQSRIEEVERRAAAAEARAQAAEAQALATRRLLSQVEEAIRSRFFGEGFDLDLRERMNAAVA